MSLHIPRQVVSNWPRQSLRVFPDREAAQYVGIGPFEEREEQYEYVRLRPEVFDKEGMTSDILASGAYPFTEEKAKEILEMVPYWGIVDIWIETFGLEMR